MFKDPMVRDAILLQLRGEIIEEGDKDSSMGFRFDVSGYTVRIFKRPGRRLISCTCKNGTMFCGSEKSSESSICKHKLAALMEFIRLNNQNGTN